MCLTEKTDILNINAIKYIDLAITANCIMRCIMCRIWKNDEFKDELTIDEWKNFISCVSEIPGMTKQISFAGGEPFLKNGLLELVCFCGEKGFKTSVATNASLINEGVARQISDSGLNRVNISLDSVREDVHDYLRGVKGTHKKVMQALEFLEKHCSRLDIAFCAVITGKNLTGLVELVNWVQANNRFLEINLQAVQQPFNTSLDREWFKKDEYSCLWPEDINEVNGVLNDLLELKKNKVKLSNSVSQLSMFKQYFANPSNFIKQLKCNVGQNAFQVNHMGEVKVCYFDEPLGNIRDASIIQLFNSDKARKLRERMNNCKENCHYIVNCRYEEEL